jgi:hypothetical protein
MQLLLQICSFCILITTALALQSSDPIGMYIHEGDRCRKEIKRYTDMEGVPLSMEAASDYHNKCVKYCVD